MTHTADDVTVPVPVESGHFEIMRLVLAQSIATLYDLQKLSDQQIQLQQTMFETALRHLSELKEIQKDAYSFFTFSGSILGNIRLAGREVGPVSASNIAGAKPEASVEMAYSEVKIEPVPVQPVADASVMIESGTLQTEPEAVVAAPVAEPVAESALAEVPAEPLSVQKKPVVSRPAAKRAVKKVEVEPEVPPKAAAKRRVGKAKPS